MDINTQQFAGTWAVILGGSSGFGLASAQKLASHGMNIAVLYRETAAAERQLKEKLTGLADKYGVIIAPYNINALDNDSRASFMEQFRQVTGDKPLVRLLLHSIARGNLKPLMNEDAGTSSTLSIEDIQLTSYAMATSLLDWARDLVRGKFFMQEARIIGLTSEGAHKYWDSYGAVSVAKASLESLATYLAVELGAYGIRTNVIQAGVTATPSLKRIPGSDELIEMSAKRNPLGRMTTPEDVANAVYLLCTPEAGWINGALLHVDGGEHCR